MVAIQLILQAKRLGASPMQCFLPEDIILPVVSLMAPPSKKNVSVLLSPDFSSLSEK
jgi:hypothetical protein